MSEVAEAAPRPAEAAASREAAKVRIETKSDDYSFDCAPGETILAAGLAAGYDLPYECATGTCGTCHGRVMDGEVDPGWVDAPGYRKLKRDRGDVLMCQARPLGPCHLRVKTGRADHSPPVSLRRSGRVDGVRSLTKDVVEFDVELSEAMTFRPGQFVTLRHGSLEGSRAYSMVNFARSTDRLTFVIKRKADGGFSNLIQDRCFEGAELDIVGPLGRATFRPEEARDFLCIAGGSGIAGMMAMLRHATDERYFTGDRRGQVFFGVRTLEDAFYLEHFAEHVLAGEGALDVTIAVSDETSVPDAHHHFRDIRLASGMVHEVAAAALGRGWSNAIGFVAGPPPMVDAAIGVLIKAGINPQNIRYDKFS